MSAGAPACPAWRRSGSCPPTKARWDRRPGAGGDGRGQSQPVALSRRFGAAAARSHRREFNLPAGPYRGTSGDGSDALLTLLANAYVQPGDEVIFSEHAFWFTRSPPWPTAASPVIVPEVTTNSGIKVDVDAMLAAVTPRTRLRLYRQSQQSHRQLSDADGDAPPACRAAVVGASGDRRGLCEYVQRNDYEAGIEMVSQFDNVVMTRTFSKITVWRDCASAGRSAPAAVADVLNRMRGPVQRLVAWQQLAAAAASRPETCGNRLRSTSTGCAGSPTGNPQAGPAGGRQRGEFRADPFRARRRTRGQGRRISSANAGPDPARALRITAAGLPCA
jgi:hypothetical protein